jgi:hypothetical protein
VNVKPESEIKKNYEASTSLVPERFKAGVSRASWQSNARQGQELYEQQMARAEVLRRRLAGIEKVSDEAWKNATIEKGQNVIAQRMRDASQKQVDGYRPYREALISLDLPPRVADPMQNLMNRAGAVVQAMTQVKRAQTS